MGNVEARKNLRKERVGIVTSNKMQKTIVVRIYRKSRHPLYGKVIEAATKFKVHDEKNEARIGDRVRIVETRPLSRQKRWRLVEVLGHGTQDAASDLKDEFATPAPEKAAATVKATAPSKTGTPAKTVGTSK